MTALEALEVQRSLFREEANLLRARAEESRHEKSLGEADGLLFEATEEYRRAAVRLSATRTVVKVLKNAMENSRREVTRAEAEIERLRRELAAFKDAATGNK